MRDERLRPLERGVRHPIRWRRPNARGTTDPAESFIVDFRSEDSMAKPHRALKKANHGSRPANSKARKAKRKHIRT